MRINAHASYQWGQGKIYIINGCSLGHFYKTKFLTTIKKNSHNYKKNLS